MHNVNLSLGLDFRTKFLATLIVSTVMVSGNVSTKYFALGYFLTFLPFALLLTEKKYKVFVQGLVMIIIALLAERYILNSNVKAISFLALMLIGIILKMMPGIMMGYYAVFSTSMCDMIHSLKLMKMPDALIIPISVIFRFAYSIREDYRSIKEAVKLNKITIKEPVRYFEYKVVPLFMCATKAADDVAISAMTRGLRVNQKMSSISDSKLKARDYFTFILLILLLYVFWRSKC